MFKFFLKKEDDYALLKTSSLFDATWYLTQNPDVAAAGIDPLRHYLDHGVNEGREPSAEFDSAYYLSQVKQLPDALQDVKNPLLHYMAVGKPKGLAYCPPTGLDKDVLSLSNKACFTSKPQSAVSIIIPIYNAVDELESCLASLIRFTYLPCRVILINDASPDQRVGALLARFQAYKYIEVYNNPENLGFSGTVNRGITLAGCDDVLVLNSDTCITPGWLGRLRFAAYADDKIATVTPVSNNAGAFSVPVAGANDLPVGLDAFETGRLFAQAGSVHLPLVPTGHGFCLYIKRACLDQVGVFDAKAFPKGYGEENDFCMRAGRLGWSHVIDGSTWIFHTRSASFGDAKDGLMAAGRAVVDQRYPDYSALVGRAFGGEEVLALRQHAGMLYQQVEPMQKALLQKPRVLYVISTLTGGTPQTNQDLMDALADNVDAYVLQCDSRVVKLMHFVAGRYQDLARVALQQPIEGSVHLNDEYDQVIRVWLSKWAIELVHIRHIAWHSLGLVDVVKSLGLPCVFSFHDFYTVCPTVKLLDDQMNYCAGRCTSSCGRCVHELWPDNAFTHLKHNQVKPWRRMFADFLAQCDRFVTTNHQAKALILSHFPSLGVKPFEVIEHGRDFDEFKQLAVPLVNSEPIRVLVLGTITPAKGLYLIEALASELGSGVEVFILGDVSPVLNVPSSVKVLGAYRREDLGGLIAEIKPHIGVVLSIWPETWCHTLTEYWAHGVPVVASPLGAVGERLAESDAGWLLRDLSIDSLAACLKNMTAQDWAVKQQAVLYWQQDMGKKQTTAWMAEQYWQVYEQAWQPLNKSR